MSSSLQMEKNINDIFGVKHYNVKIVRKKENIFKFTDTDIQIATLPGYAEKNQNVWYYVIEKERASLLVAGYFSSSYVEFDSKNMFIYNF